MSSHQLKPWPNETLLLLDLSNDSTVSLVPRLYVRNFWSQEKRLPSATLERMLTVLRSLYSCQIERCFLSLATNLLLEMTSQSPDFTRNMFEYPLSECTFQVLAQFPYFFSFRMSK